MRRLLEVHLRHAALAAAVLALTVGGSRAASAQQTVTSSDVQRVQDSIDRAARDVDALRSSNPSLASRLTTELNDARDQAAYLRVKLRKNETIDRDELSTLSDHVADIDNRARGDVSGGVGTPSSNESSRRGTAGVNGANGAELPVGTEFDVRLQNGLNSGTAQPEDRFEATTLVDLDRGERVLVPAGSTVRGTVTSVQKATRLERTGRLTVAFDRITINGTNYPMRGTVTQALQSEGISGEKEKIGAGAGVGAIIGGILGGVRGALAGILIGGGGTIAATEGKDVDLPAGTVLRVRLDTPLQVSR